MAKLVSGRKAGEYWFSVSSVDASQVSGTHYSGVTLPSRPKLGSFETPLFGRGRLEQECARLSEANERQSEEVRHLRALIARLKQQTSTATSACPPASYENRALAAEMLVELSTAEGEVVLRILGSEPQPISEIAQTLSPSGSLRIGSLLANCHAAIVDGDMIVPTGFGRALFEWILKQTESATDSAT
jgi:hypothetical protein